MPLCQVPSWPTAFKSGQLGLLRGSRGLLAHIAGAAVLRGRPRLECWFLWGDQSRSLNALCVPKDLLVACGFLGLKVVDVILKLLEHSKNPKQGHTEKHPPPPTLKGPGAPVFPLVSSPALSATSCLHVLMAQNWEFPTIGDPPRLSPNRCQEHQK